MEATALLLFGAAPCLALGLCLAGLAWRLAAWLKAPQPWPMTLTPAPASQGGALKRLAGEVLASPTLWRSDRALWLISGLFHACLLLVALRHLRYVLHPVPAWALLLQTPGEVAGHLLPLCLMALLLRRLVLPGPRLLAGWRGFLPLLLLLALALSGVWLRLAARPPLPEVKTYALSLLSLSPQPPPWSLSLALHLALAWALVAIYPFGRLVHGLALLLNPVWGRPQAPELARANPWDGQVSLEPTLSAEPDAEGRRAWDEERYQDYLRSRWSLGGVHRVLGAGQRAARQGKV